MQGCLSHPSFCVVLRVLNPLFQGIPKTIGAATTCDTMDVICFALNDVDA